MSSSNSRSTIARSEPHTLVHFPCIADVILVDTLISWFAGKVKPSTIYSTTLITSLVSALDYCGVETADPSSWLVHAWLWGTRPSIVSVPVLSCIDYSPGKVDIATIPFFRTSSLVIIVQVSDPQWIQLHCVYYIIWYKSEIWNILTASLLIQDYFHIAPQAKSFKAATLTLFYIYCHGQ